MTAGLSTTDLYTILIVLLVTAAVFVGVFACYIYYRKHAGAQQGEAGERPKAEKEGRSEDPSDLPYENLPFHGFHKPPKKFDMDDSLTPLDECSCHTPPTLRPRSL